MIVDYQLVERQIRQALNGSTDPLSATRTVEILKSVPHYSCDTPSAFGQRDRQMLEAVAALLAEKL